MHSGIYNYHSDDSFTPTVPIETVHFAASAMDSDIYILQTV